MDTIDRKVLYSMHFGEYTVNIHGLLQYNVDEDIFVWRSEGRRAMTKSFINTEELLACVQGQQDDGDQRYKLQVNRWAYAPNSIPIQNAHKWNGIKLEDVDSILDCDRLDIVDIQRWKEYKNILLK